MKNLSSEDLELLENYWGKDFQEIIDENKYSSITLLKTHNKQPAQVMEFFTTFTVGTIVVLLTSLMSIGVNIVLEENALSLEVFLKVILFLIVGYIGLRFIMNHLNEYLNDRNDTWFCREYMIILRNGGDDAENLRNYLKIMTKKKQIEVKE
jgi:hypothetical protein